MQTNVKLIKKVTIAGVLGSFVPSSRQDSRSVPGNLPTTPRSTLRRLTSNFEMRHSAMLRNLERLLCGMHLR
jgi:hypothetical protein